MIRFLLTLAIIFLLGISSVSGQKNLISQANRDYQKGIDSFRKTKIRRSL